MILLIFVMLMISYDEFVRIDLSFGIQYVLTVFV